MLEHFFVFLFWKYALFFFLAFEKRARKRGELHDLKVFIEVLLHKNLNFGQYSIERTICPSLKDT